MDWIDRIEPQLEGFGANTLLFQCPNGNDIETREEELPFALQGAKKMQELTFVITINCHRTHYDGTAETDVINRWAEQLVDPAYLARVMMFSDPALPRTHRSTFQTNADEIENSGIILRATPHHQVQIAGITQQTHHHIGVSMRVRGYAMFHLRTLAQDIRALPTPGADTAWVHVQCNKSNATIMAYINRDTGRGIPEGALPEEVREQLAKTRAVYDLETGIRRYALPSVPRYRRGRR